TSRIILQRSFVFRQRFFGMSAFEQHVPEHLVSRNALASFSFSFFLVRNRAQQADCLVGLAFRVSQPRLRDSEILCDALVLSLILLPLRSQFLLDGFELCNVVTSLLQISTSRGADRPGQVSHRVVYIRRASYRRELCCCTPVMQFQGVF